MIPALGGVFWRSAIHFLRRLLVLFPCVTYFAMDDESPRNLLITALAGQVKLAALSLT